MLTGVLPLKFQWIFFMYWKFPSLPLFPGLLLQNYLDQTFLKPFCNASCNVIKPLTFPQPRPFTISIPPDNIRKPLAVWRFNPFVANAPFLYPLKTSENCKFIWCFQGVEKGYIGNKWVREGLEKNVGMKWVNEVFATLFVALQKKMVNMLATALFPLENLLVNK